MDLPPAEVVGAAIVDAGRVLAARRTRPLAAAGRWEFPGGKVEPGETPEAALVREVAEELGCTIAVEGWLEGRVPIGDSLRAERRGRPPGGRRAGPARARPGALAGRDELDDVDWLDPDRPFLAELRLLLG